MNRGRRGRDRVDRIIRGERRGAWFLNSNCHFIFMLFVVGNIVSEVE